MRSRAQRGQAGSSMSHSQHHLSGSAGGSPCTPSPQTASFLHLIPNCLVQKAGVTFLWSPRYLSGGERDDIQSP